MPDKKKRKKPLKYQGKKKTSLSEPEKESADQTPPPKSPEESGSPELDPSVNVQGADTISQSIEDKMTTIGEPSPDSSSSISDDDLDRLLRQHEEWVDDWIRRGRPAGESSPVTLQGRNLSGKDLSHRNLETIDLTGAEFDKYTNFWGADLTSATLKKGKKKKTLDKNNLGGTILNSASLPAGINFAETLQRIKNSARITIALGILIIVTSLFLSFSLANISDIDIHIKKQLFLIPLGGFKVPIPNNYWLWVALPAGLLIIYLLTHIHLHRFFYDNVIKLPSFIPGKGDLDEVAGAWLFNSFITRDFPFHEDKFNIPEKISVSLMVLFYWILYPCLLFIFWLQFLPVHELSITIVHIGLLFAMIFLGLISYYVGRAKLQHGNTRGNILKLNHDHANYSMIKFAFILSFLFITILSSAAIKLCLKLPVNICYSNLNNNEINEINFKLNKNLRYLIGDSCKIVKCNLFGADLFGARLQNCTFEYVNLQEADLSWADLTKKSSLKDVNLTGAVLNHADLSGAILDEVNLSNSQLKKANLSMVRLIGSVNVTNFTGAVLEDTDIRGADLRRSKGLTPSQLANAIKDEYTLLPGQ